jgi:hypothetical protein
MSRPRRLSLQLAGFGAPGLAQAQQEWCIYVLSIHALHSPRDIWLPQDADLAVQACRGSFVRQCSGMLCTSIYAFLGNSLQNHCRLHAASRDPARTCHQAATCTAASMLDVETVLPLLAALLWFHKGATLR